VAPGAPANVASAALPGALWPLRYSLLLSVWVDPKKSARQAKRETRRSVERERPAFKLMAPFAAEVTKKYSYAEDTEAEWEGGLVGGAQAGREQRLDRLTHVFLPNADVSEAGPAGEIASVCGAIEELDLVGNRITEWRSLLDIAAQLPRLRWLGLNQLALAPLATLPDDFGSSLGGVRSLCLSKTGMVWDQLLLVASAMPELASLHFGANGVTSLAPSDVTVSLAERLSKLTVLWVEENQISSWEEVVPLSELPLLEVLNLNSNQLPRLPNPPVGFRALKQIMLRANPIFGWDSITGLDALPSLRDAALRDIPLIAELSASSQRRSIIARLGGLKFLNGSEVVYPHDDPPLTPLRATADTARQWYTAGTCTTHPAITQKTERPAPLKRPMLAPRCASASARTPSDSTCDQSRTSTRRAACPPRPYPSSRPAA